MQFSRQQQQQWQRQRCSVRLFSQVTAEAILPDASTAIPLVATCTFTITILDVNNHGPVFQLSSYEIALATNEPVGHTVMTLEAIDLDEGENGTVLYNMFDESDKYFRVDENSWRCHSEANPYITVL
ncbi:PREDICTED: protocadherin beta-3-like, partial [Priapulus caudatus]|uniref:Protocadherin beta-3-like n=1 Tax=Priapulus caudatus TaxID=37621 RepID=A0ABM1F773_PRICU